MATRTQTQSQMNTRNLTAELTVTHLGVYYMVYLDWKEANEGFFFLISKYGTFNNFVTVEG